jgi:hypothetical protein
MRIPKKGPSKSGVKLLLLLLLLLCGGQHPTLGLKTLCTSVFFGVEEGLRSSLHIVVIIVKRCHWVWSESHPVGHFAFASGLWVQMKNDEKLANPRKV